MSFDALTIAGILSAVAAGGFLIGLVSQNDKRSNGRREAANAEHRC